MKPSISTGWSEETPEAKARWFQSLTLEERMEILCEFTELALTINPDLPRRKRVTAAPGGVRVVTLP